MLCFTDVPYMGGVKRIATPITRERRIVDNTYIVPTRRSMSSNDGR